MKTAEQILTYVHTARLALTHPEASAEYVDKLARMVVADDLEAGCTGEWWDIEVSFCRGACSHEYCTKSMTVTGERLVSMIDDGADIVYAAETNEPEEG